MAVAAVLLLIYFAVLIAAFVVYIKYLRSLQKTLERCAVQNRSMAPGMVWLQLVPMVNLGWQFVNVISVGRSLEKEFRSRGVTVKRPCQDLGVIMGILVVAGLVFIYLSNGLATFTAMRSSIGAGRPDIGGVAGLLVIGFLFYLAAFVLWIIYWSRLDKFGKRLDALPRPMQQQPWLQPQPAMGYAAGGYGSPRYQPPSYLTLGQPMVASVAAPVTGTQQAPGSSQCRACATLFQGGRFCPRCGASQNAGGSGSRV
jgi:hypothetical protein